MMVLHAAGNFPSFVSIQPAWSLSMPPGALHLAPEYRIAVWCWPLFPSLCSFSSIPLLLQIDRASQRLNLLRNTNVYNDAFKIW